MKLITFSVKNYRSIVEASQLSLGDYTVLVGPNNEGKSNIVKAIALSLAVLNQSQAYRRPKRGPTFRYRRDVGFENPEYQWTRDFPINLQSTSPTGKSEFTLEFQLTPKEFEIFRHLVGVALNTRSCFITTSGLL